MRYRLRDAALQFRGKRECDDPGEDQYDCDNAGELFDLRIKLSQVRFQIDGADRLASESNSLKYLETAILEPTLVDRASERWLDRLRPAAVSAEHATIRRVQIGAQDGSLGRQSGQQFIGSLWIVEAQCCCAIGTKDLSQHSQIVPGRVADHVIIRQNRTEGECQGGDPSDQSEQMKLVLNRKVAIRKVPSHRNSLFDHLSQAQQLRADVELLTLRGCHVDFETDPAVFQPQIDGPAVNCEPRRLADGQDPGRFLGVRTEAFHRGSTDK